jgi:hypothetical protein
MCLLIRRICALKSGWNSLGKPYEFDCDNHSIFSDLALNRALFAERSAGRLLLWVAIAVKCGAGLTLCMAGSDDAAGRRSTNHAQAPWGPALPVA